MLDNIRIVLCAPSHPGNIGAAARAMGTMGLSDLVLVGGAPPDSAEAVARASGAAWILERARVVETLEEAIGDCALVAGSSARPRSRPVQHLSARDFGARAIKEARRHRIAVLFGNERSGLSNDEIARCHIHTVIPANPDYTSLNLAAAVQVICYEIYAATQTPDELRASSAEPLATGAEMAGFFIHLERTLIATGFIPEDHAGNVMSRLRRFYQRARPEADELHLLRGCLAAAIHAARERS